MSTTRRPLSPLELQLAEQFADARLHAVALTVVDAVELGPLLALHADLNYAFAPKYGSPLPHLQFFFKEGVFPCSFVGGGGLARAPLDVPTIMDD